MDCYKDSKGKYAGKTLLELGSNVLSNDMIRYAKENGAYTIAADYYPLERSEAKKNSDEAYMISTADIDALSKLIEAKKVDGVIAGIHEFNLLKAMYLSDKFHLPFFCDLNQWDNIEHKEQFRQLCIENLVPCPKIYFHGDSLSEEILQSIIYPVVVKPVDGSASRGVHICNNEGDLKEYWKDALNYSSIGKGIIEEFVKGDEFTAHYTICNGKAALSCIDNRYPIAVHNGVVTTIPIARIYPSTFTESYLQIVNPAMLRLCNSMGLKNAVIFIQGIHCKETGRFWIFEAGLRSAGEAPNRFIAKVNGIDYMNLLVDQVLLNESMYDQSLEDPFMHGKCCGVVSFVAKPGKVAVIQGLEEAVANTPSVISYENRYPVGSETPDTDTLRQLMIRFIMICDSREQMAKDVDYLNRHITVLNEKGENMVIKMNPERIVDEF